MNRQWVMEVSSPLVGFTKATVGKSWNRARAQYVKWKRRLRGIACEAGIPLTLNAGIHYEVRCAIAWRQKARVDTDDVLKGVNDSLWRKDRAALTVHAEAGEFTGREELKVIVIERWARRSTTGGAARQVRRGREIGGRVSVPRSTDPYSKSFRQGRP